MSSSLVTGGCKYTIRITIYLDTLREQKKGIDSDLCFPSYFTLLSLELSATIGESVLYMTRAFLPGRPRTMGFPTEPPWFRRLCTSSWRAVLVGSEKSHA